METKYNFLLGFFGGIAASMCFYFGPKYSEKIVNYFGFQYGPLWEFLFIMIVMVIIFIYVSCLPSKVKK